MRSKPQFAWKHKPANLPNEAYQLDLSGTLHYIPKEEKRWCKNHPISYWGKRSDGEWFDKCVTGNRLEEDCEVGINETGTP